jgi:8-oxo-dGTP pyrophosphatase MutT (NUDIX family)
LNPALFRLTNKSKLRSQLVAAFNTKLPGYAVQCQLSILNRAAHEIVPAGAKRAAVLAILFWENDQLKILYIKRTVHRDDKHSGQISFPGGKWEPEDLHFKDTAVREANEEVGGPISKSDLVGALTPLYIPVSNYLVYPFVAYLESAPTFSKQDDEIAALISFPVADLLHLEIFKKDLDVRKRNLVDVPYFDLDGKVLWGATAMMTNELRAVIKKS